MFCTLCFRQFRPLAPREQLIQRGGRRSIRVVQMPQVKPRDAVGQLARKIIANEKLPAVKIGRERRILKAGIMEFFEENL